MQIVIDSLLVNFWIQEDRLKKPSIMSRSIQWASLIYTWKACCTYRYCRALRWKKGKRRAWPIFSISCTKPCDINASNSWSEENIREATSCAPDAPWSSPNYGCWMTLMRNQCRITGIELELKWRLLQHFKLFDQVQESEKPWLFLDFKGPGKILEQRISSGKIIHSLWGLCSLIPACCQIDFTSFIRKKSIWLPENRS